MKKSLLKLLFVCVSVSSLAFGGEVLAVVNGDKITTDVAPKDFKTLDKSMQEVILDRLIEKKLASDYALSTDIAKSEVFKKSLEHILKMSPQPAKDSDNLAEILKKDATMAGYTQEQLYSKKGLLAFDFLLNDHAEKMKLTDEEVKEFYEMQKYKYDTPAMLELLTIVVEDVNLAKEIKEKIEKSDNKLETFSALAREHSLAPGAKENGYFGKIAISDMNEVIKAQLKGLKRNELSLKLVKTQFGYQFFYVLNDIPEFNSKFEDVKTAVNDELVQKEVKRWAMNTISELKKSASIEIK